MCCFHCGGEIGCKEKERNKIRKRIIGEIEMKGSFQKGSTGTTFTRFSEETYDLFLLSLMDPTSRLHICGPAIKLH